MKNVKKILLICLLSVTFIFTLSSCSSMESPKSAYDIAVEHGFIGSEEEWLASLKGQDGKDGESLAIEDIYKVAVENGFEGDLLTFVATYFKDAKINGKSAYDLALEHGFQGSEEEWLASLKGATGNDGKPGSEVDLYQVYLKLVDLEEFSGTYEAFLQEFLNIDVKLSFEEAITKAMQSCLKVLCMNMTIEEAKNNKEMIGQGGAGVIYKLDKAKGHAYVITNYHVVYNERLNQILPHIYLFTYGQEYLAKAIEAKFIGGSATYDIAILEIKDNEILKNSLVREIDYVDSNELTVGTTAIAIGNPKNDGISVTQGIVCVDSETIEIRPIKLDPNVSVNEDGLTEVRVIRIDTAVNSGNSGGGLFNANGDLIGIVNAKFMSNHVENMSYAIPSNIAIGVAQNIIRNYQGNTPVDLYRPLLGIVVKMDSSSAVLDPKTGLIHIKEKILINDIVPDSCCLGKLQVNDELVSITVNGREHFVDRMFIIPDALLGAGLNDEVTLKVLRNNEELTFKVIINKTSLIG